MKPCLAYLLAALVLLQTFSRELLVVDFALNQATITARFCVNQARPALHCNGKCYFAKKLRQQEERQSKSAGPLKERLEMLPATFSAWQPPPPPGWGRGWRGTTSASCRAPTPRRWVGCFAHP